MADQAEDVINSKYGEEIGHLEHLSVAITPLMESIDLDNATYNEQMLAAVTGTGQKAIQSSNATPLPTARRSTPLAMEPFTVRQNSEARFSTPAPAFSSATSGASAETSTEE